jgi:hypothetical protein
MAKDNGTIEQAEPKKKGRKPQWTQSKVEIMCKAIAAGKSYKDAYTAARVSHTAFYSHYNNDAEFLEKVKKAEREYQDWYDSQIIVDCKRSLLELIRGYEYDEVTTETGTDLRGKPVSKKKITHKKVGPNPTAIIFALCNRDPDNWKNRVNNEITGKIDTDSKQELSLKHVPDDLLAQVIDAIKNK